MATTRRPKKSPVIDMTQPMTPLEIEQQLLDVKERAEKMEASISDEARAARRWRRNESHPALPGKGALAVMVLCLGIGGVLGAATWPMMARESEKAAIYKAMKSEVPVVRSLDISSDPGKYEGKMVDVIMTVNRGGVYKSGKGLYLQEFEGAFNLIVFQGAFEQFVEGGNPSDIVARYLGKVVKARGTVRRFQDRMSLVVYAPGLISEMALP